MKEYKNLESRVKYAEHTAKEIEELIGQTKYLPVTRYNGMKKHIGTKGWSIVEDNRTITPQLADLFDDFLEMGTFPTQAVYVKYYHLYQMSAINERYPHLKEDEEQYAIAKKQSWNRATTAYMGNVVQYHALLLLRELYPKSGIYISSKLDQRGKIDIVLKHAGKYLYIHVTSNSANAKGRNELKKGKAGTVSDTRKDLYLTYSPCFWKPDANTKFIGQYPLLQAEYVVQSIEQALRDDDIGDRVENFQSSRFKQVLDDIESKDNAKEIIFKVRNKVAI